MARLRDPYVSLADFASIPNVLSSPHLLVPSIHSILTMLRTHFHPNLIVHGDLHFGNIFVDRRLEVFELSDVSVQFIDFGRTVTLSSTDFTADDISYLLSIDAMALLRAACQRCHEYRGDSNNRHAHAEVVKLMLKSFLNSSTALASWSRLEHVLAPSAPSVSLKPSKSCEQCALMYDWIDRLLRHPMFKKNPTNDRANKRRAGDNNIFSFLDITAGL